MASRYDHTAIEKKWQEYWLQHDSFACTEDPSIDPAQRCYVLDMFPYPSGAGLHVGHPEGYTASDIVARYKRMKGCNVLHPMGWDAFGLPAENYAIATGTHPRETTRKNIERFKQQIRAIGFSYDWDREIATIDPSYYKWTQWIFLQMYKHGLAYMDDVPINWCPHCKTGLANEEVVGGSCDRCDTPVEQKNIPQWMLKITAYADRLLEDLESLEWTESIKQMQRNWIGRSEGAEVDFVEEATGETIRVFTTRADTLFGATYMVLAPEHPLVDRITTAPYRETVRHYQQQAARKTEMERTEATKEKTGAFTGAYAINPVNEARIPVWISDYVLRSYGTGAIMAVPAHDERDFAFAQTFSLPIIRVVTPRKQEDPPLDEAYVDTGYAINSGAYDGLDTGTCAARITADLQARGKGKKAVNYKLRDWVFSRQRYWGEPIPLVHCPHCGVVPVDESDLPVTLPEVERYEPTGTARSPLAAIEEWVTTTCPRCGAAAQRETNTMPQWAGSCWYYLRYMDPHNDDACVAPEKMRYWGPVDLYIGGAEHAVLHLLYARFWHKFLYDIGVVDYKEPFQKLVNQGMIYGEDGQKMSKSRGNVINPDDVIVEYGADTLRMYEMFMGPLEVAKSWNTKAIGGIRRFLERVWRLVTEFERAQGEPSPQMRTTMHRTIKKVTEDTEQFRFNTAISALMVYVNELYKQQTQSTRALEALVLLLAPYVPHIAEELWERLGHEDSLAHASWPEYDEALTKEKEVTVVVQINGKLRDRFDIAADADKQTLESTALAREKVQQRLEGATVRKVIVVPGKLVNIVAG
jgi:leucyl-tRNA synthetase